MNEGNGIVADCPHCHSMFEADRRFAGGIATCPRCGKAVEVGGLRDPLWRALQLGAVVAVGGAAWFVGRRWGPTVGVAAGLGAAALVWLLRFLL